MSLSIDRNSSTSIAAPDRLPQTNALSVVTDRAPRTFQIVPTPQPYMRGACVVCCDSCTTLGGAFIARKYALAYIAAQGGVVAS